MSKSTMKQIVQYVLLNCLLVTFTKCCYMFVIFLFVSSLLENCYSNLLAENIYLVAYFYKKNFLQKLTLMLTCDSLK